VERFTIELATRRLATAYAGWLAPRGGPEPGRRPVAAP
jgi:hypothetical protein